MPTAHTSHLHHAVALSILLLSGCISYQPLPLTHAPTAARDLEPLVAAAQSLQLPGLEPHAFDPAQPLDMTAIAMLAVIGNPDLKLARGDAGIVRAQAFAAGLLPDPQFSLARDYPSKPNFFSTFNTGLSLDLGLLVTLSARRDAAGADARKADLTLLWQEWQVVAQARKLFADIGILEQSQALLRQALALADQRLAAAERALAAGNLTMDTVSSYQTAQADVQRQFDEQTRLVRQTRTALNLLLGLASEVKLALAPLQPPPALDERAVQQALQHLPTRRPDLLALEAGYQAEEARLRAVVLAQFPTINVGFTRARDTSRLYTSGFTLGLSLPIFTGSRGNIAIETATRQRLHDEYQSRVNAAHAEIAQVLDDQALLRSQLVSTRAAVEVLARSARAADQAYAVHQMTITNYVDLQSALLAKRMDQIALERTALEQQLAVQALLGGDVPRQMSVHRSADGALSKEGK